MDGGERAVAPLAQPHRFGSGGSEFFICFTSRPSSSSMRIPSSKSLPSPGRADKYRDPAAAAAAAAPSLSASLSRRLKSSGSVKGGQSPATIPAGGGSRRKSCAFEAAEPSSPKVTCIGQVKVKTARMKKKKKTATTLRSASQRAGRGGGEATFRRLEERGGEGEARGDGGEDRDCLPSRNHRWVHLPLGSICDALRAFGSEFNCFFPCGGGGRSLCGNASSSGAGRGAEERTGGVLAQGDGAAAEIKRAQGGGRGSCGAALARWLMAVHEGEGAARRAEMVELVVDEVGGRGMARELRGMEVMVDAEKEESEGWLGGAAPPAAAATAEDDGEAACVPPPNALLLMRCRSDPVRMAALATRFWGSPAAASVRVEVDEEEDHEEEEKEVADPKKEELDRLAVLQKDGDEEPGETAEQSAEEGSQAAPASIATETVLRGGPLPMADEDGSRICKHEVESEVGKMLPLHGVEEPHCHGKGERDEEVGHCAEAAAPELEKVYDPSQEDGEEAPRIEKAAAEEEDASGLVGTPSLVVPTEQSERLSPATEQERASAAGGREMAATKYLKPIFTSAELHGRRTSISNEKDEGRRSSSKEIREGRRHSFCTEKDARRTSSFRDKEGRRCSFSVESDFRRPSLSCEGEGRRRWSFSSEKEARRPVQLDTTAGAAAAVVMDKRRRKKKKKEGEEGSGAAREDDLVVEVRSFERPIAAATAPPAAAEEARRRGEKRDELPDCLLLMMYEPKLSMEVSRETWVCTSDFLRFRPHPHRQQPQAQSQPPPASGMGADAAQGGDAGNGGAAENNADETASSNVVSHPHPPPPPPPPPPPAPSTASAPAATSASPEPPPPEAEKTPEKKPANAAASSPFSAPFGLTRCKSEPMRSTAKMEPDACFWKSRHRPIGAAGIGF